jgi:hypothetical protein
MSAPVRPDLCNVIETMPHRVRVRYDGRNYVWGKCSLRSCAEWRWFGLAPQGYFWCTEEHGRELLRQLKQARQRRWEVRAGRRVNYYHRQNAAALERRRLNPKPRGRPKGKPGRPIHILDAEVARQVKVHLRAARAVGLSNGVIGRHIQCSGPTVSRYRCGKSRPPAATAAAILALPHPFFVLLVALVDPQPTTSRQGAELG